MSEPSGAVPAEELVDIVDADDRVVRTVTRAEMRAQRLLHRAVSIAVLSSDGRLLVHRRADTKDVWPGMWDIAAGGVVGAGETYDVAARRELAEELGVEADQLVDLGGGRFEDDAVALLGRGYLCTHDGPFTFTDGEIAEVRWVDRADLERLMAVERFVPDNVALLLPLVLPRIADGR
ncbi:MAG: NUDIX hydrolase [Ilumatobacteraceae bacterium]